MPIPVYKYKINTKVPTATSDNTIINSKPIVEPVVAPDELVKSNIRENIDRVNKPGGSNSVTRGNAVIDAGTRVLEGVKTLGTSMIGDAIQGVSPDAAQTVSKYTGGLISPTPEETLIANRTGQLGPRINSAVGAVNSAVGGELLGEGMNYAGNKIAGKMAREAIQDAGATKMFDVQNQYRKKGIVPDPEIPFKSEIDWGKFNSEIPQNKQLMTEYSGIEQNAKQLGTWMKNPDGSNFNGIPEQFVQQNSSNFKNAFGDSKLVNPNGSPTIQYHGSTNKFDTFDESKFGSATDEGWHGKGIYASPSEYTARTYSENPVTRDKGFIYQLYANSKNPGKVFNRMDRVIPQELSKDFGRGINQEIDKFNYDLLDVRTPGMHHETVIPFSNPPKSAMGNNGMFDMSNPNIYKAIVPAIPAGIALKNKNNTIDK